MVKRMIRREEKNRQGIVKPIVMSLPRKRIPSLLSNTDEPFVDPKTFVLPVDPAALPFAFVFAFAADAPNENIEELGGFVPDPNVNAGVVLLPFAAEPPPNADVAPVLAPFC